MNNFDDKNVSVVVLSFYVLVFNIFVLLAPYVCFHIFNMIQVGKDQEKAQSEKDSHSKNRGGKKNN